MKLTTYTHETENIKYNDDNILRCKQVIGQTGWNQQYAK